MKPRTFTVRDYVSAFSRVVSPVTKSFAKGLTVSEYMRGREQQPTDTQAGLGRTYREPRRPGKVWAQDNYDIEHDRYEREMWRDETFYNDGEHTWDGTWHNDEAWRR